MVDFDLPIDSLVKSLKGNVFIDSCNKGKFDFATKINFPKQNKFEEKYTKFPLRFEYYSKCKPFERIGCGPELFHIVYNNNMENFSRIVYEEYLEILDSLPRLLNERIDTTRPIQIIFKENTNQAFIKKVITIVSIMNIEKYKNAALNAFHKELCDLDFKQLTYLKTNIEQIKIEVLISNYGSPFPPPQK